MKFSSGMIFLMLFASVAVAEPTETSLSREAAILRIQSSVKAEGALILESKDVADAAVALVKAEIARQAPDTLPNMIAVTSERGLAAVVDKPVVVKFFDPDYCRYLALHRMSEIRVQLAYQEAFPPLDQADQQRIAASIGRVIDGIQSIMERKLIGPAPLYSREEIAQHLESVRRGLVERIGDPDSYWFTKPLPEDSAEALLQDFDDRLGFAVKRIPEHYERVQSALAEHPPYVIRRSILGEITLPVERILRKRTTDIDRKRFDADDVVPGYSAIYRQLTQITHRLEEERAASSATQPREADQAQ